MPAAAPSNMDVLVITSEPTPTIGHYMEKHYEHKRAHTHRCVHTETHPLVLLLPLKISCVIRTVSNIVTRVSSGII